MSTLNKIFAKFSAQEPMKVEFANAAINSLIAGLKAQIQNLKQAKSTSTKDFSDYENLKIKVVEQVKVNDSTFNNALDLGGEAAQVMSKLEDQLKDLGMNVGDFKEYGEIEKFRRELLDEAKEVQQITKNIKGLL